MDAVDFSSVVKSLQVLQDHQWDFTAERRLPSPKWSGDLKQRTCAVVTDCFFGTRADIAHSGVLVRTLTASLVLKRRMSWMFSVACGGKKTT